MRLLSAGRRRGSRVDKQECMRSSSATKVAMSAEPGTVCCYLVWKTHAPAKTLSLIIFNRAGNVGDKPCHNALHHQPVRIQSHTFLVTAFPHYGIRSCQPLSIVSLVAGVTPVCVKCRVDPAALDRGVAECQRRR
jgi:hypothetical protein